MNGAVQEKDTRTRVKAIKNIPEKLLVWALESALLVHFAGNIISKAPRKEIPKVIKSTNTKMLNNALLEIWYNVSLPKMIVSNNPRMVKIAIMEIE